MINEGVNDGKILEKQWSLKDVERANWFSRENQLGHGFHKKSM